MGARNADRIWLFAGAVVIVLLVVASYLLLIGPKYTAASGVRVQVEDTQTQLVTLQRKIADLNKQKAQLPKFKAALAVSRLALPVGPGVSDFLRQLQKAGDKAGVSVTGISVASPAKSTVAPDVWELPMTLNAAGNADKLSLFITQLQTAQARAVLVKSASYLGASGDGASLSLTLTAYVSPPAGTGVPIVTSK